MLLQNASPIIGSLSQPRVFVNFGASGPHSALIVTVPDGLAPLSLLPLSLCVDANASLSFCTFVMTTAQAASSSTDAATPHNQPQVEVAIVDPPRQRIQMFSFLSPQVSSYFIAGGVAGAASRTVVSPLERLKIIQ